jgi:hypothetical protein
MSMGHLPPDQANEYWGKAHECRFVEEQEPSERLILSPCLICGVSAMDALSQLRWELDEVKQRMYLILSTIYSTHGYLVDGAIDTAAKFRAIERLARLDWDEEGFSDVV